MVTKHLAMNSATEFSNLSQVLNHLQVTRHQLKRTFPREHLYNLKNLSYVGTRKAFAENKFDIEVVKV